MCRALVILWVLLAATAAPAQDAATLLARLESADEDVRDAAEEEWDELDEEAQVRLARAALGGPEAPGARAAAQRLSPWSLDLDEMHRQAQALLQDPELEIVEHGLPACIGAPEVLDVWRVAGERTGWFEDLHRVTGEEHLAALLAGARDAPDATWASRVWSVRLVAWNTDARRGEVAALLAADLERLPDVELPRPARPGSGLPPQFETIARCAWGLERSADRGVVLSRVVPWGWLLRWTAEVVPTAADLPFLDDVIAGATDDPHARAWALRHRVRLAGDGAVPWLTSLLEDERGPDCEPELAAHLALLGRRDAWDALTARDPEAARSTPLAWRVDRDAARDAAADGGLAPDVQAQACARTLWDVELGDADLAAIAARIAARVDAASGTEDYPWELSGLVDHYVRSFPEGVRGAAAKALATQLAALRTDADALGPDTLRVVLGLLEVRARDELVRVLRAWSGACPELRGVAVAALISIGEPVDADVAWTSWNQQRMWWGGATALGLHSSPVVGERLRTLAESGGDEADAAVAALARRAGLPRLAVGAIGMAVDDATRGDVLAALGGERPHDAVRVLWEATEEDWLVDVLDPESLRDLRTHRENGLYWRATLGLALAGDEGAIGEMERLLRENRTPILDELAWPDDPRIGRLFARLHAQRLADTCCSRFQGATALRTAFPTIPVADDWTLATQREIALAWLDAHEDDLVFSEIANGWLPR